MGGREMTEGRRDAPTHGMMMYGAGRPPVTAKHGVEAFACSEVEAPGASDVLVTTMTKGAKA